MEPFIPIKPEGGGLIPDVYETTINLRRLTGLPVSKRAVMLEQLPLGYIILALKVYGGTISWGGGVFPILTHSHHDHSSDWLDVGYFYSVGNLVLDVHDHCTGNRIVFQFVVP